MPCESSMTVMTPSRNAISWRRDERRDRVERRVVAAHAEDAVEDDDDAADAVRHRSTDAVRGPSTSLCLKIARCADGTFAMRIARMMQLWFSSSPIQNVSGPASVIASPSTVV